MTKYHSQSTKNMMIQVETNKQWVKKVLAEEFFSANVLTLLEIQPFSLSQ